MVNIPKAFFRKETILYKNFSLGLMVNKAACANPPYMLAAHQRRLRPLSLTSFPFSPFFPARLCKVPIKKSALPQQRHLPDHPDHPDRPEISKQNLSGLAVVRLTHEYRI